MKLFVDCVQVSEVDVKGDILMSFTRVMSPYHLSVDNSGAEQSSTTRTRPCRQRLSSLSMAAVQTMPRSTQHTTIRSARQ